MTITAVASNEIAPGHHITRVNGLPQLWQCTCGDMGRGEPFTGPADLVDALHAESRWKRRADQ